MKLDELNPFFRTASQGPSGDSITGTGPKESKTMVTTPSKPASTPVNRETEPSSGTKSGAIGEVGASSRGGESEVTTNKVNLEETRRVPDERLEKLNAKNMEGHEKNMKAIEDAVSKGDEPGKPDPKLGREDNGNTPRIMKDGTKIWGPPGVAGATR